MKIVNKKILMTMQTPIVFSNYEPSRIYGLFMCVDNTSMKNDFVQVSLLDNVMPIGDEPDKWGCGEEYDLLMDAVNNGTRFRLDLEGNEREAMYDDNKLYVVYEEDDIVVLLSKLSTSLSTKKSTERLLSKIKTNFNVDDNTIDEFMKTQDFKDAKRTVLNDYHKYKTHIALYQDVLYKKYKLWSEENKSK